MSAGDWDVGHYVGSAVPSGPTWKSTTITEEDGYKEPFEKLITYMLGSNLPQTTKDEFVNSCMRLKEFRKYVAEYFPQYADKINLWEKLHNEQS